MAIVITNGKLYLHYTESNALDKTTEINNAHAFSSVADAISVMRKACKKTNGFYVYDTYTNKILWKHMTNEELTLVRENKRANVRSCNRKKYSQDVRKLIYGSAGGCCELCGKKILFEDMTLDHIKPLSMGGGNEVENLACTCYSCNIFKGSILPDDFINKITQIFLYQVGKKNSGSIRWRIVKKVLSGLL